MENQLTTTVDQLLKSKFYPVDIKRKKIYLHPESTEKALCLNKWEEQLEGYTSTKGSELQAYPDIYNTFEFISNHLTQEQTARFHQYLESVGIKPADCVMDSVSRKCIFHDVISLGDDLRIVKTLTGKTFHIAQVVASTKETALAFDAVIAKRNDAIADFDMRHEKHLFKDKADRQTHLISRREAVNLYRFWPRIEEPAH